MKIRPVGAELFDADRQTDMTKLIAVLRLRQQSQLSIHSAHQPYHCDETDVCDSSAGIATRLRVRRFEGRIPGRGKRKIFSHESPEQLWGSPRLLLMDTKSSILGG